MKKRVKRKRKQVSVWQAMNEPVVQVTDKAARAIFLAAAVILLMVWLMPQFGGGKLEVGSVTNQVSYQEDYQPLFGEYPYYEEVAGATTETGETPEWYEILAVAGEASADAFSEAATEVLDISEPVGALADFYEPGFAAVQDAWLELMADPVSN